MLPMTLVIDGGFVRVSVKAVGMVGVHSCEEEEEEGAGVWSLALWSWQSFICISGRPVPSKRPLLYIKNPKPS